MKRFLAGTLAGFLLAIGLCLLCFRYQVSATSVSGVPVAYRINRLTGQTLYSFGIPGRDVWRRIESPEAVEKPLGFVEERSSSAWWTMWLGWTLLLCIFTFGCWFTIRAVRRYIIALGQVRSSPPAGST